MSRLKDIKKFYNALEELETKLGGKRTLGQCDGRMDWPERGVYFFFEPGEFRSDSGKGLRVTRVGTHALNEKSKTTLWQRLSQHRGVMKSGLGNHRGSIFRLLVGEAIKNRNHLDQIYSWGMASDPGKAASALGMSREVVKSMEAPLEQAVSRYVRSMPFLWINVDDAPGSDSERGYIERNAIALLSNWDKKSIDAPSDKWLGNYSGRDRVRLSSLWNNNHVDENYEPGFVDHLSARISQIVRY